MIPASDGSVCEGRNRPLGAGWSALVSRVRLGLSVAPLLDDMDGLGRSDQQGLTGPALDAVKDYFLQQKYLWLIPARMFCMLPTHDKPTAVAYQSHRSPSPDQLEVRPERIPALVVCLGPGGLATHPMPRLALPCHHRLTKPCMIPQRYSSASEEKQSTQSPFLQEASASAHGRLRLGCDERPTRNQRKSWKFLCFFSHGPAVV